MKSELIVMPYSDIYSEIKGESTNQEVKCVNETMY